jgi:hypothetical protein
MVLEENEQEEDTTVSWGHVLATFRLPLALIGATQTDTQAAVHLIADNGLILGTLPFLPLCFLVCGERNLEY